MPVTGDLARYRHLAKISSGGMATVDLAQDTVLGRQVALKRLAGTADPGALSRLRREALAGASVSHRNLVSIFDVVSGDDGELVIVMEYVPGETLRDALDRHGRLPAAEALRILDGVAAGLDAIHARGIVHRDVKPSNILLDPGGAVKVADLGIAAVSDRTRITIAGSVLGSLSYMAPEQLADEPATPAIDVYALSAVAYEMLSGERAHRESNPMALAHAISSQPPPDLRQAWAAAPAAAAVALSRGMSRDPRMRPGSAGELVGVLHEALGPRRPSPVLPVRAVRPARPAARPAPRAAAPREPGRTPARRRRGLGVAAVLLGLAAAAAVLVVLLSGGGAARSPSTTQASAGRHRAATGSTSTPSRVAPATAGNSSSATSPASAATPASATTPATPVAAVESFYRLAAAHQTAQAWALADPALRAQLEGYDNFRSGQAGDRSITFDGARTVHQTATTATVAITTTSARNDGTHRCTGTIDLSAAAGSAAQWQLHQLHISCTERS